MIAKNHFKWQVRMVENGAYGDAERGLTLVAAVAVLIARSVGRTAIGTGRFTAPSGSLRMSRAILLGRELIENLHNMHDIPSCTDCSIRLMRGVMNHIGQNIKTLN